MKPDRIAKLLLLCAAALGLASGPGGPAADAPVLTDVFTVGAEGYHTYRIPALLVTKQGTLLAFCEGRKTGRGDHGDVDLVLKRSTDGGKTWGPLQLVHEEGGDAKITIGNPCPVLDRDTGTVWLPFTRDNADVFVTSSTDDGKTWAKPVKITDGVKKPDWSWYATGPGVGIQLRRGEHKGRLVIPCDHKVKEGGKLVTYSHVITSDDRGKTWKLGGRAAPHTNECQAAELADGSLVLNMRNYWGKDGGEPARGKMRAVALSKDGGATWGEPRFDKALVEPVCQASLHGMTDAGGKVRLLFANPRSRERRERLTVRLSYDGGDTWPVARLLEEGPSAYSCLADLPDGALACLYERGGKDPYEKITFARFSLAWLTDGKDRLPAAPRAVGHRGLAEHAPENTLANFRACFELRLGVELDVRRTKDGRLVVLHDATVDRTTDGRGAVGDLTLAELRKLDAGAWFAPAFRGERVPALEEVFALMAKHPGAGPVAVDLKEAGAEDAVVRLAREHGVLDRLVFIGLTITEADVRRRLRKADPKAATARLAASAEEIGAALADPDAAWVYVRHLPARAEVDRIYAAGRRVFLAGPKVAGPEVENWRQAADAGVDAILTDHPLELTRVFRARPAEEKPARPPAQGLERLPYNHPGLTVDLGVGLWAWPLPMDFDGDGDLDLVVNCPDKPSNGVYVFENPGGDKFPVFKPARRISRGLQNVQVSYVDGKPRVLSPGFEYPDFLTTGLDKGVKLPPPANVHPNKVRANMWRYADYDGDGRTDLIVGCGDWTEYGWDNAYDDAGRWTNGPLRGFVYLLRNTGTAEKPVYDKPVKVTAGDKPVETFGWPSPNFADFDGDGDLDLLCGEFLDGFTYFENTGTRRAPRYAPGRRLKAPDGKPLVMDLQMITPTAIDWDGDGDLDLVVGDEDGRVALVEHTGKLADGVPQFLPPRYFRQQADNVKFGALVTPAGIDWDGDGDTDLLCGNTAGYVGFLENLSGPGVERPRWAAPKLLEADGKVIRIQAGPNGSIQGPCEAKWGYTTLTAADWDGDGLPDLVVNSIWGKVHWYRNVSTRKAPKLAAAAPVEVEWDGPPPTLAWGWLRPEGKALLTQWRTTPVAVDWDRDGLTDLVMLDTEGYLAFFPRARRDGRLVLLPPRRVLCDERGEPLRLTAGTAGKSGRRKLCVTDWDGDGKLDVLVNSANAGWLRQVGAKDGRWLFRDMGNVDARNIEGHDTHPAAVDWNNDGVPDLVIGAEDGHLYYLRNPRTK